MIYLDNAADTCPKSDCIELMWNSLLRDLKERDYYAGSWQKEGLSEQAKKAVAGFFHAETPEQVHFTGSAGKALYGILRRLRLNPNHTIYVSPFEPDITAKAAAILQYREGIPLRKLPLLPNTIEFDLNMLQRQFLEYPPAVVVISHISNITGAIHPVKEILELARAHNAITILDASQSAGLLPIDFQHLSADFLVFSSHKKLYGLEGGGGYLCKREWVLKAALELSKQHKPDSMVLAALKAVLRWGKGKQLDFLTWEQELAEKLVLGLKKIPKTVILRPASKENCTGIVTFAVSGYSGAEIASRLKNEFYILVRSVSQETPYLTEWLRGAEREELIRVSFGWFNTGEEVKQFLNALKKVLAKEP